MDNAFTDARIRLAMRILELEQAQPPALKELASRVGLSPFHLAHRFKDAFGEGCAFYGRRIRLDASTTMMVHDDVPLSVVAATFGFASQVAFTRAFTRQFGLSPGRYVAERLGHSQSQVASSHLKPVGLDLVRWPPTSQSQQLVRRPTQLALTRRSFGNDLTNHWRHFLSTLPKSLNVEGQLVGMSYDNAQVTPAHRWRYDCAVVIEEGDLRLMTLPTSSSLDLVEIPGGLHAEINVEGGFPDLWRATIALLTDWLPTHRDYRCEGDPLVHWLRGMPNQSNFAATATIRIRPSAVHRPITCVL